MMMSKQRFLLRRLLKNICDDILAFRGTLSNDVKLYKSSKRSYFGSRGKPAEAAACCRAAPAWCRAAVVPDHRSRGRAGAFGSRPTLVTAVQRAVLCEDRIALSLPCLSCRRHGWWPAAAWHDPALGARRSGGSSAVLRSHHAARYHHVRRPSVQRLRR